MPKYHGVSHPSGLMFHEKPGTFCWARNCVGGTEVIAGTIAATPSCCTRRWASASAAAVLPCGYVLALDVGDLAPVHPAFVVLLGEPGLGADVAAGELGLDEPTDLDLVTPDARRLTGDPSAGGAGRRHQRADQCAHAATATKIRLLIRCSPLCVRRGGARSSAAT